jgi:hypothetical protein
MEKSRKTKADGWLLFTNFLSALWMDMDAVRDDLSVFLSNKMACTMEWKMPIGDAEVHGRRADVR